MAIILEWQKPLKYSYIHLTIYKKFVMLCACIGCTHDWVYEILFLVIKWPIWAVMMINTVKKLWFLGFYVGLLVSQLTYGITLRCPVCIHIHVNNFSKSTRPRDMLLHLKDTLSV